MTHASKDRGGMMQNKNIRFFGGPLDGKVIEDPKFPYYRVPMRQNIQPNLYKIKDIEPTDTIPIATYVRHHYSSGKTIFDFYLFEEDFEIIKEAVDNKLRDLFNPK